MSKKKCPLCLERVEVRPNGNFVPHERWTPGEWMSMYDSCPMGGKPADPEKKK